MIDIGKGGKSVLTFTRIIGRMVTTDSVATQFCWTGNKGKKETSKDKKFMMVMKGKHSNSTNFVFFN